MKKILLLLVMFVSMQGVAQNINNFKYVAVPLKFDFMTSDNQYRLATLSKYNLVKAGFEAFYNNEVLGNKDIQRCDILLFDVIKEKSFLATKLHIEFRDCYGQLVYQSETGYTKEKDYEAAYTDGLNKAFISVAALNYHYEGPAAANPVAVDTAIVAAPNQSPIVQGDVPAAVPARTVGALQEMPLYAQPVPNGYQLVDTTPKVIMKLYTTSTPNSYIAEKDGVNGVLVSKDGNWFFEYYKGGELLSEKIAVKF